MSDQAMYDREKVFEALSDALAKLEETQNALAGLEPGDVATLVGLVRRCVGYHPDCSLSEDERALLARLPK